MSKWIFILGRPSTCFSFAGPHDGLLLRTGYLLEQSVILGLAHSPIYQFGPVPPQESLTKYGSLILFYFYEVINLFIYVQIFKFIFIFIYYCTFTC